jgi:hypothetical protein
MLEITSDKLYNYMISSVEYSPTCKINALQIKMNSLSAVSDIS